MKKFLLIFLIIFFNKNTFADDQMTLGKNVYQNKAMCGTCHRLKEYNPKLPAWASNCSRSKGYQFNNQKRRICCLNGPFR